MATDWDRCSVVERDPDKRGGALIFRGTRMPVATVFINLKSGLTVDEILKVFPDITREQIEAVIDHEIAAMRAPMLQK